MNRFRFSLKRLLVIVSLAAVACAALLTGSPVWSGVMCGLAFLMLATSAVAALVRQGPARAFWIGCAVFGWGYFYFGYETPESGYYAPRTPWLGYDSDGFARNLPTTSLLMLIHNYTAPVLLSVGTQVEVQYASAAYYAATVTQIADGEVQILWRGYTPGSEEWVSVNRVRRGDRELFFAAGHSLFLLLFALAGGLLAKHLRGLPERPQGSPAASSTCATAPAASRSPAE